ncbi:MAG: epoxyqueuosine reductase QueH [Candidatus Schekmanbacteria bacterium]|nr:epoxyqueuosine reductase QueH [Candidatus Schekmanbacteria bacterium]
MNLLLHICCAPCTVYPHQQLTQAGVQIKGFFFNPNIHPLQEFKKRLLAVQQLQTITGLPVIYRDEYGLEEFVRQVVFREQQRCSFCYFWRLEMVAKTAKEQNCAAFSSTLLYSKYQKHELIKEIAEDIAQKEKIPFYYEDFRRGFSEGINLSRQMQLYRQPYCGCIYSEAERYK